MKTLYSPDNALSTRADGFEVLISLQDGEGGVAHLHRVELTGVFVAHRSLAGLGYGGGVGRHGGGAVPLHWAMLLLLLRVRAGSGRLRRSSFLAPLRVLVHKVCRMAGCRHRKSARRASVECA